MGLSGGVDSSAAVILLKNQGFQVAGLYFDVLKEGDPAARSRAEKAAEKLGIDLICVNAAELFEEKVINYFCSEYARGRTPSPCAVCNPLVKLKLLCCKADEMGFDRIATGHYVSLEQDADGSYYAAKGAEPKKDQSYMLCRVPQEILGRIMFPLADITSKNETRALADAFGLGNSEQRDSQDLCFFKGSARDYLRKRGVNGAAGYIKDEEGRVLKAHDGIAGFTVGQRKGLGIALGKPVFVSYIDPDSGDVILSDDKSLYKSRVWIEDLFFTKYGHTHCVPKELDNNKFMIKLRYTAKEAEGRLVNTGSGRAVIEFDEAQRAPAPGQFAAVYCGKRLIGSGVIMS